MAKKKAWRLIFAEGILGSYMGGEEVCDFRKLSPGSHEFKKGQIIEGHFLEGVMLLLEVMADTKIRLFSEISEPEYRKWGVSSHEEMMEQMRRYYPNLVSTDTAALNRCRLARIDNRPIAGPLPEGLTK